MTDKGLAEDIDLGTEVETPEIDSREVVEVVRLESDVNKLAEKPEGIPDEFWDEKAKDLNKTALLEGYKQKDKIAADLRKIISKGEQNIPEAADKYKLELDQSIAKFAPEGDPAIEVARTAALEAGLSQDQFNKFVGKYLGGLNEKEMLRAPEPEKTPDQIAAEDKKYYEEEMEKLGDSGKKVFEDFNQMFRDGYKNGMFTDADKETYKEVMYNAATVQFMQRWSALVASRPSSKPGIPSNHIIDTGGITLAEVQAMQADPKYQNEAGHAKIMAHYRTLERNGQL